MRLIIDSLIALMLACLLGAVILHYRHEQKRLIEVQQVHAALSQLQEQVLYRGAWVQSKTGEPGFPRAISPVWFPGGLPMNCLAPPRQPWLDVAPVGDHHDEPPDPVITSAEQAAFWYNPNRGLIRARVLPQFTQNATLELYNRVNGTLVRALNKSTDPARKPEVQPPNAGLSDADELDEADDVRQAARVPTLRSDDTDEAVAARMPTLRNDSQGLPVQATVPTDVDLLDH